MVTDVSFFIEIQMKLASLGRIYVDLTVTNSRLHSILLELCVSYILASLQSQSRVVLRTQEFLMHHVAGLY